MELYDFQKKAVAWLVERPRAILGSDMGTGKTVQLIVAACLASKNTERKSIQVVCPASLQNNWKRKIADWAAGSGTRWQVNSYDIYKKSIIGSDTEILIFDESHKLKNPKTDRVKGCLGKETASRKAPYVWFATGTPFPNNLIDIYVPAKFCQPKLFGGYWDFAERYSYVRDFDHGKRAYGIRRQNLPELVELMRPILWRDKIEDVLPELPGFQEDKIEIPWTSKVRSLQKDLEVLEQKIEDAIIHERKPPKDPIISHYRQGMALEKIPALVDFVLNLKEQGKPVVVFALHRAVISAATVALAAKGIRTTFIDGSVSQTERDKRHRDYEEGKYDCIVLSIMAAGEGLDFVRGNVAVFLEIDWMPGTLLQAMGRIRRIGQASFCLYYYFYFADTVDERIFDWLFSKAAGHRHFWNTWEGKVEPKEEIQWGEIE